mgnify:CR=1 FL=1
MLLIEPLGIETSDIIHFILRIKELLIEPLGIETDGEKTHRDGSPFF